MAHNINTATDTH